MTNPFIRLISLKQEESRIALEVQQAKAEAITFYKANPVLTGKKTTGQFSKFEDQDLPAILTWMLVSKNAANPVHKAKIARLREVEKSLETIHAVEIEKINTHINELRNQHESYLTNEETKKLLQELSEISATVDCEPREDLTVTFPK